MASKLIAELSADDLHARWGNHIARSADEWIWVLKSRTRFRSVARMFDENEGLKRTGKDTFNWIHYMWGCDALMAIRRELDDQHGAINIRHLLHEMEQRPDVMTRRRFMEYACPSCCWCHYPKEKATATRHFESFDLVRCPQENEYDGFERDYVRPESVAADRKRILAETNEAFTYAQVLIAHRTPKDHLEISTEAIFKAIDVIWEAVRKYYLLLNSEPLGKHPRPPKNWKEPFRQVWVPEIAQQTA